MLQFSLLCLCQVDVLQGKCQSMMACTKAHICCCLARYTACKQPTSLQATSTASQNAKATTKSNHSLQAPNCFRWTILNLQDDRGRIQTKMCFQHVHAPCQSQYMACERVSVSSTLWSAQPPSRRGLQHTLTGLANTGMSCIDHPTPSARCWYTCRRGTVQHSAPSSHIPHRTNDIENNPQFNSWSKCFKANTAVATCIYC